MRERLHGKIDDAFASCRYRRIEAAYAVDERRRVRHRHDGGDASARRRARGGAKIFLVSVPGVSGVNV